MLSRSRSRVALAVAAPLSIAAMIGGIIVLAASGGSSQGSPSTPPREQVANVNGEPPSFTVELGGQDITLQLGATGDKKPLEDYLAELAKNLGVDVEKLKAALKTTALAQLDRLVAEGKMPQAIADRMRAAITSGDLIPFGPLRGGPAPRDAGPGPNGPGPNGAGPNGPKPNGAQGERGIGIGKIDEALATFLGVTLEQLKTELPGKSLAQVAQAHGKSPDTLKQHLLAEFQKHLQQRKLPQEQVNQLTQRFTITLDRVINHVFPAKRQGGPNPPPPPRPNP